MLASQDNEGNLYPLSGPATVWLVLVFITSCVLCFVPLFNLLAFEFAFAVSVPLSLGAGLIRARQETNEEPWWPFTKLAGLTWIVALLPITLNALRVQNCDYLEGALLFLVFPVISTLVSALWGATLARLTSRSSIAFIALWFSALLLVGYTYYIHPPVDLYSPFMGYWPGAIYDDVFRLEEPLLWSRLEDILLALGAYILARIHQAKEAYRWRWTILVLLVCGASHWGARNSGVYRDATFIQAALGGEKSSETLRVFYPQSWSEKRVELIFTELEFAYSELESFFGSAPKVPITVYLYSNQQMKKRLMGARRTSIAKPWQWNFHVDRPKIDRAVIVHEMAHVFAAQFNDSLLKVPHGASLLPNMALVEGIAEAATWRGGALDLHQWSAALHRLKLAPKIEHLLAPERFYGQHSRTVYTLCGSIYRYVHQEFGQSAVLIAYETGDFAAATGVELSELTERWSRFLQETTIPANALEEARAMYDRPAIFGRVCAREIASLRRDASRAIARGDRSRGVEILDSILNHLPKDVRSRTAKMRLYLTERDLNRAEQIAEDLAADKHSGGSAKSLAHEVLGDIALLRGSPDAALAAYSKVEKAVFSRGRLRAVLVKRASVGQPISKQVVEYLYGSPTELTKVEVTERIVSDAPAWPTGRYLRGRALLASEDYPRAIADLSAFAQSGSSHVLRFESWRLMAHLAFTKRCYQRAAEAFASLASQSDLMLTKNEVNSLERWARRSRFFGARLTPENKACSIEIDIVSKPVEDSAETGNSERAP